jgi:hypothetical protein
VTNRAEVRRSIRTVLISSATVGTICEALPHLARGTIEREVHYLCSRQALAWNGRTGRGSKYVKQEV